MWSIDHPATTFRQFFEPVQSGRFVLNVLVSAKKWDSYPSAQLEAVGDLASSGLVLKRIQIPNSVNNGETQSAVHLAWSIEIA